MKIKLFCYSWFAVAPADFVRLPSYIKTKIKAGLKNLFHVFIVVANTVFVDYCLPLHSSKISCYSAIRRTVFVLFIWIWFSDNISSATNCWQGRKKTEREKLLAI
jgi:hypothetical protein